MINNLPRVSANLYRYTAINETRVYEERKKKYNRDWTTLSIDRSMNYKINATDN